MNVNNDEMNLQWLQNTNNNPQRQQPEHSTQIDNLRSSPSIIRNAISMHLSRGLEVEEVAIGEVDSADGLSLMSNGMRNILTWTLISTSTRQKPELRPLKCHYHLQIKIIYISVS
ncbi:uncharacterized protein LOC129944982 [Eupeodes corollae]|uniref:uncharacterized protein LOC129944982 n=1 Tax=Eupeodes corollae TaxID=290404 RepID=UPI002491F18A|nr:uncharacterized protein LOC129944982 [Eupeodes corollae]